MWVYGVRMDKGTLYRLALARLGSSADVVEGTPEWQALEDCAQQAVALALDYSAWNFALKGPLVLTLVDGVAELPGDCLELRECSLTNWRLVGRKIVNDGAEAERVEVVYKSREIADTLALPEHEAIWCEACVLLVAAAVAGRVTGRADVGVQLQQQGLALLYRARLKEARAISSNDQVPHVLKKGGRRWAMA